MKYMPSQQNMQGAVSAIRSHRGRTENTKSNKKEWTTGKEIDTSKRLTKARNEKCWGELQSDEGETVGRGPVLMMRADWWVGPSRGNSS